MFAIGGGLLRGPVVCRGPGLVGARRACARVIASGNILQAAFMVVGSIVVALLQAGGLAIGWIFLGLGDRKFRRGMVRTQINGANGRRAACSTGVQNRRCETPN